MSINKRIIKLILIAVLAVFILAEGMFLFALPYFANSFISKKQNIESIQQKTGLTINFKNFKIKTYPDFSLRLIVNNVDIKDKTKQLVTSQHTDLKLNLLPLLLKNICVKSFIAEESIINITKQKDNKFYFGQNSLESILQILENFGIYAQNLKIENTKIIFDDQTVQKTFVTKISSANLNYKKHKLIDIYLEAETQNNLNKPTKISVDFYSKLPLGKGVYQKDFKSKGNITNLDLATLKPYIEKIYKKELVYTQGILNANFEHTNSLNISSTLSNFKITAKNPLDTIKANNDISLQTNLEFAPKLLIIKDMNVNSKDWNIETNGEIKNYTDKTQKNIKPDITILAKDCSINALYNLVPSIQNDTNNIIQKLKKTGLWGKANGELKITNNFLSPDLYGKIELSDLYIEKINEDKPHSTANINFEKDKLHIKTRVYTSTSEYGDIEGTSEILPNGKGSYKVTSTPNADLQTALQIVLPVQDILGFELGPLPYMTLQGSGEFDLDIKGTITDSLINGKVVFKNAAATLDGLNTKLTNGNGSVIFKEKNILFSTKSVKINNNALNINGKANHNGDINFDITSNEVKIEDLFNILNTSPILEQQKLLASPLKKVTGKSNTKINIQGKIKDFSKIQNNESLKISGILNLKNATGEIKDLPIQLTNTNGIIKFDNNGWETNLAGYLGTDSVVTINGSTNKKNTDLKIESKKIKISELTNKLSLSSQFKYLQNIPQISETISFEAEYKTPFGLDKGFSLNNLCATGKFNQEKKQTDFTILNGTFTLNKGTIWINNFDAKWFNSQISSNMKIEKIFSENPIINGSIAAKDFNISILNTLKNLDILPKSINDILKTYENYNGFADAYISCKNSYLDGWVNLKNINFTHSYFKTPITIDSGKVVLDGTKVLLKSIIAQIDTIPAFLNLSIYDIDKTMTVNGYLTTKFNEYLANKYINPSLSYPIKPKGDITVTTNIFGTPDSMTIQPKIKLAQNADIYYMGANLDDEKDIREIIADINIIGNTYNIKKLNYRRYMTSQNDKSYPLTIISANGTINQKKDKSFVIQNLDVTTPNKANAKIFNILFKKSILKNGMFNCKLNIKGTPQEPQIKGNVVINNINMPLYDTLIKNMTLNFEEKTIDITSNLLSYNSDMQIHAQIQNSLQKPYQIKSLDIKSDKFNLDRMIDALTTIPTPNTATKLVEHQSSNSIPIDISDIQINNGLLKVKNITIKDLQAHDYTCNFKLGKNLLLDIDNLKLNITTGEMTGTASYDFTSGRIKTNIKAKNVDANQIASSLFGFEDQIFGQSNGTISMTTSGNNQEERIKNMTGHVYFEIADGKMPKLGSVEYLLKAGNFIKSGITGASINNLIELLNPIKTGQFSTIKGKMTLKNGIAQNMEIYSKSDNLNLFINGEFDILQQYANMRVFGRLTKKASGILGPIGNISLNSLLNSIPGIKLTNKEKNSLITDINKIPGVELSDKQYRLFTVKIDGGIKDDNFVKNFRWIEQ